MFFTFRDLAFSAGKQAPFVLSAAVEAGEILVVRGPSGVGKSTLLRILARLQPDSGGTAYLEQQPWQSIPPPLWRASVHYVAQRPALFDGNVADNFAKPFSVRALSGTSLDPGRARALMRALKLPETLWEQDARTLSGGEASRVAFIRGVLIEPKVLLLDEPTAALDEASRTAFYAVLADWLKGPGRAALLVSHTDDYLGLPGLNFLDLTESRVNSRG
ncbi:putative iron export ATP-binding protein FetA [Peptococcaceae bacterium CEB3]|nr:putative iron export ATP-binding protein FetA [Peptococcaceae bacterium CEB3]